MNNRYKIGQVRLSVTDLQQALFSVKEYLKENKAGYICVTNVRATYVGNHDQKFCDILNNSLLTLTDGKPLEWYAHLVGKKDVKKCSGDDFFKAVCKMGLKENYSHFFYGSTQENIDKLVCNLKTKYPGINIVGAVSPPVATEDELASEKIINLINSSTPDFVWVGLGAPKQERVIKKLVNKIDRSILVGVGLVFDYQAGKVKRSPKWMQHCGLEGVYRCVQQPGRVNFQSVGMLLSIFPFLIKAMLKRKEI